MRAARPRFSVAPAQVFPKLDAAVVEQLSPNRVGIVFVHGIGTQPACETFLNWSGPIVEILGQWRGEHENKPPYVDPVVRCEYDLSGQTLPFLEVALPEYETFDPEYRCYDAQTWVMTEAWWASVTRPPSLGTMTAYVRHALWPIMCGIRAGYQKRSKTRQQRRRAWLEKASGPDARNANLVFASSGGWLWAWIDWLDHIQMWLTIAAFIPALLLGTLVLLLYAPFRAIPIQALRDAAILKSADNFLTRWFGELPDILDDPIQAANVRFRLINAIRGLRSRGCGRIVVVGHSGGTIVTFTTLLDREYANDHVDKFISHGEAIALAWRIEGMLKNGRKNVGDSPRLIGDLRAIRPGLKWADFWASYDPACGGRLPHPDGAVFRASSHATVNRMSILEDHGSYWDNDEGFVIPLMRHFDTPNGYSKDSRFYRDPQLEMVRLERRRQRVGVLALWRWIATLAAALPLGLATIAAIAAWHPGPDRLGGSVTFLWGRIPGHEIIAGPLDFISRIALWPDWPRLVGEWLLGVAVVGVFFLLLARIGVGLWSRWDRAERIAARKRTPFLQSRTVPAIVFTLGTANMVMFGLLTVKILWS